MLFIGDIFSSPGRDVATCYLEAFRSRYDFIIANAENTSGGHGLSRKHFKQLRAIGIDAMTLGNHSWDNNDTHVIIEQSPRLLRPLNYPAGTPGLGCASFLTRSGERLNVMQAMGRVFMEPLDCPFAACDSALESIPEDEAVIVDFHAEATSEKKVMGYHLRGRVAAVLGTHTHVQTADEAIYSGTAYISDVGMTGAQDSAIGVDYEAVHQRLVQKMPARFEASRRPGTLCAVELELEGKRALSIRRLQWRPEDNA